jgi:hypothetical protein
VWKNLTDNVTLWPRILDCHPGARTVKAKWTASQRDLKGSAGGIDAKGGCGSRGSSTT